MVFLMNSYIYDLIIDDFYVAGNRNR